MEINNSVRELQKMNVKFTYELGKTLNNILTTTDDVLNSVKPEIDAFRSKYIETDEYGDQIIKNGAEQELDEKMNEFYNNKKINESDIGLKLIPSRDFKVKEEYKNMMFDIKTVGLLITLID